MRDEDNAKAAAKICSQLAEDLHRTAQDEAQRHRFARTGRPDLDAAVERALDGSREFSERGIAIAAGAAAAFTAKVFEEGSA
ncbi:hypothetical protein [Mycolicibacterium llatzerense]|uniref:hypothetical protein n=1 Tax=Mycolicibacterium llatzerense TaxID=280871 RepID=UPI0013A6A14E|nr:hypothetical protein [Mycolicibacterium llatzerense]